jgi:predicted DNA binding CopG/RHH family protein
MAKIKDTAEAWESRTLGADEAHVTVADHSHETALDEALELQSISIRLPKQLINQYKLIAHFHKVGYQPLMRDVMARFVPNALKEILEEEQTKAKHVVARDKHVGTKASTGKVTAGEPMRKAA